MSATLRSRRKARNHRRPAVVRLSVETLETRLVPAPFTWTGTFAPKAEVEPNDTINRAQDLGNLTQEGQEGVVGTIGNDAPKGGAVDWYQFTLTAPADVHLATLDKAGGSQLVSVLSLYNSDAFDFTDHLDPLQHRLLAQDDGSTHGGDARIDRLLGPGVYFVAVSGAGNLYFHPQLPDSGYPGSTGDYGLAVTTTDAGIAASDGPAVLTVDPAPGSTLARSPFVIRVDLSGALDPGTFNFAAPGQDPSVYASPAPGQTIELRYSATGDFSPGNYSDIPITANFSPNISTPTNELQILPAAPLAPGIYQLFLAGNSTGGAPVLADFTPLPLGTNSQNPNGADFTSTFQINGIDGVAGATTPADTISTAHDLKDVTSSGLVQAVGAIGVDPTDAAGTYNPAAVEMYHFTISGSGRYAFTSEVFARRIGSPLHPTVTLFQRLPDGTLHLVDVNSGTGNNVVAPDGTTGLLISDATLFEGLKAGDYFLAVSAAPDYPDVTVPWQVGPQANGSFDPTTSHSANLTTVTNWGNIPPTIGPYVLNLSVSQDNVAPTVVATTPAQGATLAGPPTQLSVQFSKPVNLLTLANKAFQQTTQSTIASVYILRPSDGQKFFPRVQAFDQATNTVPFLMLDDLPDGTYELHLSGPLGLTDFAGNPLVGNDPSGDYVVTFRVRGGFNGDPLQRADQEPNDDAAHAQDLGLLFPKELAHVTVLPNGTDQNGVTVTRDFTSNPASAPADTADFDQFQVLQDQTYVLTLNPLTLPQGLSLQFTLWDSQQNVKGQGTSYFSGELAPGTYVVGITGMQANSQTPGWSPDTAAAVAYQLNIALAGTADNPPPLTYGAGPAIRVRLATDNTPPSSSSNSSPPPASNPPANPTSDSPNPPPAPPANSTPPPPPSNASPTPPASPPPVSPPAVSPPPAAPPAVDTPPSLPVASLPPSSPPAPPRLNLPIPGPLEAPPAGNTPVVSATPPASGNSAPTGSGLAASPSAPAAPAAAAASVPSSGTIPAGLLVGLGAGPTGGVQTFTLNVGSPTPERIVVQGPNPITVDGLVRITTLTQASQLSGNDSRVSMEGNPANPPSVNLPGSIPGVSRPLIRLLQQALDSFFGMKDWLSLPLNLNRGAEPGSPDPFFNEDNLEAGHRERADEWADPVDAAWLTGSRTRSAEPGWNNALVALGVVALIGVREPRRRSQPRVRWRRSRER
jgi:hypothetical protein